VLLAHKILNAAKQARVSWSITDTPMVIAALAVKMNALVTGRVNDFGAIIMHASMVVKAGMNAGRATTACRPIQELSRVAHHVPFWDAPKVNPVITHLALVLMMDPLRPEALASKVLSAPIMVVV